MKTISRKSSTGLFAIGTALLMPFAIAQNDQTIPPPHDGTMQEGNPAAAAKTAPAATTDKTTSTDKVSSIDKTKS